MYLEPEDLAARIATAAKEAGTSVAQVLRTAGLNEQWLRDMRDGGHSPSLETIGRIAKALNMSLGALLLGIADEDIDALAELSPPQRRVVGTMIQALAKESKTPIEK